MNHFLLDWKTPRLRAVITQRKQLYKVRKILNKLPFLEFIIVVDHIKTKELEEKEISFSFEEAHQVEEMSIFPTRAESLQFCTIHLELRDNLKELNMFIIRLFHNILQPNGYLSSGK